MRQHGRDPRQARRRAPAIAATLTVITAAVLLAAGLVPSGRPDTPSTSTQTAAPVPAPVTADPAAAQGPSAPQPPTIIGDAAAPADEALSPAAQDKVAASPAARFASIAATELLTDASMGEATLEVLPGTEVRLLSDGDPVPGAGGSSTWSAHTPTGGYATVSVFGDRVWADIASDGKQYDIQPVADGTHLITVETRSFPDELPPVPDPAVDGEGAAVPPPALPPIAGGAAASNTYRLLLWYDRAARAYYGSDKDAIEELGSAANEMNAAYTRSNIDQAVEVAAIEFADVANTGVNNSSATLGLFSGNGDGFLDTVHARRNATGADLVALISGTLDGGSNCGIAYLPFTSPSAATSGSGFSVQNASCARSNKTLAHELGHNMGAGHDPGNGIGLNAYSQGYVDCVHLFRTIMAYVNPTCPSAPRLAFFSSSTVLYNTFATGNATQNNSRTLNESAAGIAGYRGAVANTVPSAPVGLAASAGSGSVALTWLGSASTGGPSILSYTVTASPGGNQCTWTVGALTCTVTGLTNGATYSFTVTATNSVGTSPPSNAVSATPFPSLGNNTFATPYQLVISATAQGTNVGATKESGEPNHAGFTGGTSVWWQWTAPTNGVVTLSTFGSSFDTLLAVYTGSAVNALTPVASNDECGCSGTLYGESPSTSKVTFSATAGTNYRIAVDGWSAQTGSIMLRSTVNVSSGFHAITPARVLDSRTGPGPLGAIPAGGSKNLTVAPNGAIPATARAVVMNVTVTGGTQASYLTAYPTGSPVPTAANLLFAPGQTVPNHVTVAVGAGGQVSFFNQLGSVHVIADVVGYYDDGTGAGDRFFSVTPTRLLDSRNVAAAPWTGTKLGAAQTRDLTVQGAGPVPGNATAVVMNVTVTEGTNASFLRVFPSGDTPPDTANVLFAPGQTVPNLVTVGVGGNGKVSIFNQQGSVHVIVDVVGYYAASGAGSRFVPRMPGRLVDSRDFGASPWSGSPIGSGTGAQRSIAATQLAGTPSTTTGLVTNVTVTGGTSASYLTVSPAGGGATASLLFAPGQTIPNAVTVGVSGGVTIVSFNQLGSVHVIIDVAGYFVPA